MGGSVGVRTNPEAHLSQQNLPCSPSPPSATRSSTAPLQRRARRPRRPDRRQPRRPLPRVPRARPDDPARRRGPHRSSRSDGSRVDDLPRQARGLHIDGPALAVLTVGGNDLLGGLIDDDGPGIPAFARKLTAFLDALPIRPVVLGTVYDPTFGDDAAAGGTFPNPKRARVNFDRMNATLRELAPAYGVLADLHAHFLTGRPDWFVRTIEPSLRGRRRSAGASSTRSSGAGWPETVCEGVSRPGDWLRSSAIGACPPPGAAAPKGTAAPRGTGTDRGRSEPVPRAPHAV